MLVGFGSAIRATTAAEGRSTRTTWPAANDAAQRVVPSRASAYGSTPMRIVATMLFEPGSIFATAPSAFWVTQIPLGPAMTADGAPKLVFVTPPVRMVAATRLLSGSIRETVPSPRLGTHTEPPPAAR